MSTKAITPQDTYLDRTAKLIPAELLTLYLTLSGMIKNALRFPEEISIALLITCAVLIIIFTPVVNRYVYNIPISAVGQHLVAMLAFILWIVNVDYAALNFSFIEPSHIALLSSVSLVLFTFLAPLVVRR